MLSKKALLNYLPLLLILVLASFLRLWWLDKVPNGISGDELTYIINAKAIWLTGSDISGTWNPLTAFIFKYPLYTLPQAELPYFILTPIVGLTQFSLFNARISFVIFSIFSVALMYFIAKELFNREVGIITGLVSATNPWLVYIGRTDYEASLTVFFFLAALLVLIKAKGGKILISIPFFYLAFYSYIGTKLLFIPFVLVACLYSYYVVNKKKYLKQYLTVLLLCLFLAGFFVITVSSSSSRIGELFFPSDPAMAAQVNAVRKASIQTPFTDIFENKFTMYGRTLLTKIFKSFASDYLFVSGDNFFSILRNGMFYVLDAFFILMGLVAVYSRKKPVFWFILVMALIGTMPQLFHTASLDNFVYHLSMIFPFLIILIAVGIWEIVTLVKGKTYFYASNAVVIILYSFLILNFLNIYFYQFTLMGYFDFNLRLFSKYAQLARSTNQPILVYSPSASDVFKKYIFYTNGYNKNTVSAVKAIYKNNKFNIDNVKFLGCNNTINPKKFSQVILYDVQCGNLSKNYSHLAVSRLSDGGQSFYIFNDKLCSSYTLKSFPSNIKIGDFSIEGQSAQKFCETYITRF